MRSTLLFLVARAYAQSTGSPSCPCITSAPPPHPVANLGGKDYNYASGYGLSTCSAWDSGLAPYCDTASPPAWCADAWCYVNPAARTGSVTSFSSYFTGLVYSYGTCGSSNTYNDWFVDNAAVHTLDELNVLVTTYLRSASNVLEDGLDGDGGEVPTDCAVSYTSCQCTDCVRTPQWLHPDCPRGPPATYHEVCTDLAGPEFALSHATTTLKKSSDYEGSAEACMANLIQSSFHRIAAKEGDPNRVGYAYGAFQGLGTYVQSLGVNWCPESYDPRFRPWYSAGAAGPKDAVIVIDVSGSMSSSVGSMRRGRRRRRW